jgi:heme/copper-type cytochrome/quinol oxidase subunit 2
MNDEQTSFAKRRPVLSRALLYAAIFIAILALALSPTLMSAAKSAVAGLNWIRHVGLPILFLSLFVILILLIAIAYILAWRTRRAIRREELRTGRKIRTSKAPKT